MKFRFDPKDHLPNQILLYHQQEYAFNSTPGVGGFTSLSVNTLSLEINTEGKIIYVRGYCPHVSWIKASLTPPSPKMADVYAVSDEPFLSGVGVGIVDNSDLPIFVDPASGWVHIPGERTAATSITPLPGVILQLTEENEFASLWLKPAGLPRYGYKRSRRPSTEGGLINALRKLGSFREELAHPIFGPGFWGQQE